MLRLIVFRVHLHPYNLLQLISCMDPIRSFDLSLKQSAYLFIEM